MIYSPTSIRRDVFIDTSAYFALTDRDDRNHDTARLIAQALQRHRWAIYTSIHVVAEQHALHLARLGPDVARQALALIDQSAVRIVRPTLADEARTREILNGFTDKRWSYTDTMSFAIMERLGIRMAFTFDSDFEQYGFTRVTPQLLAGR